VHIAYLINQYPKVSHSFIRREIHALERQGVTVSRIAIRGWAADIVDQEDCQERQRTRYILRDGPLPLIIALARTLLTQPARLSRALSLAWEMGKNADRPRPIHLIYLAEACRLAIWLKAASVDHVHAHFGTNSATVAMLVHILGGPTWSFTVHGPEEFDKPQFIGLPNKISTSAFVAAISSYGRSQLYRLVGHDQWSKIKVVRCGLEHSMFGKIDLQAGSCRFVCVGRLCEQKGQLLLLEAVRRLVELNVAIELVLAGDGEMRPDIEKFISDHKLQSVVRVTGWIDGKQVQEEIQAARALVLPSFAEGLPVVLMEAMALCRPVISTYVAGIPELVKAGENGWLVPAGDIEALMGAMRDCLAATDERLAQMGAMGQKRASICHDIDKQASQLAMLFENAFHAIPVKPPAPL
jgi:colanic acid/amylovoran biosynthesis glycosyltransferase